VNLCFGPSSGVYVVKCLSAGNFQSPGSARLGMKLLVVARAVYMAAIIRERGSISTTENHFASALCPRACGFDPMWKAKRLSV
jgi:hypothetical protein